MGGNSLRTHRHAVRRVVRSSFPVLMSLILLGFMAGAEAHELTRSRLGAPATRGRQQVRTALGQFQRPLATSFKSSLKQWARAAADSPWLSPVIYHPAVKRVLTAMPGSSALYGSAWDRRHPYDRAHGSDTSGYIPMDALLTGHPAESHGSPYAGVQPSVVRTTLNSLPTVNGFTFVDLGCGKGRPMLVATEFPFREVVGVELSPLLVASAQENARLFARRFPERPRVRVEQADATTFPMPDGNVVLFIYNSFDRELMQKVAENVEDALVREPDRIIYVLYCNPVSGDCFDASKLLTRRFARTLAYAPEEQGFAEDTEDAVIIWQSRAAPLPTEKADAEIVIVKDRWRAALRA